MTKQQRRIVRRIAAPAIALIMVVGALVASNQATSSAAGPTPVAASTSSSPTPSPTASPPPLVCGLTNVLCPIKVNYFGPIDVKHPSDPTLCALPYDVDNPPPLCHIDLRGVLYLPHNRKLSGSAAKQPLVIFVHGSTNNDAAPDASAMATYFTKAGYAFFALHRRGHGDSTGQNLDSVVDPNCETRAECDISGIENLCKQVFEVQQAIFKMELLRNSSNQLIIDPMRIAILGHSLGGIVSLCANTAHLGQRTIIDISAASESWDFYDGEDGVIDGHGPSITLLNQFVIDHVTPPMFLEPMNDCSTTPTDQFAIDLLDRNEVVDATLFPDVTYLYTSPPYYGPPITDCHVAHPNFVFLQHWVNEWGPSVNAWLIRMFANPASINTTQVPH